MHQDSSITNLEDLAGKKVATKNGSTSQKFLQKRVGDSAKIVPYPTSSAMYLALTGGAVDAVLYNLLNLSYFISTNKNASAKIVGPLYEGAYNGIAFPEDSEWVEPVNNALAAMKEDGSYAKIYEKWFGMATGQLGGNQIAAFALDVCCYHAAVAFAPNRVTFPVAQTLAAVDNGWALINVDTTDDTAAYAPQAASATPLGDRPVSL